MNLLFQFACVYVKWTVNGNRVRRTLFDIFNGNEASTRIQRSARNIIRASDSCIFVILFHKQAMEQQKLGGSSLLNGDEDIIATETIQ